MSSFEEKVERFFKAGDTDGSGFLSVQELVKVLRKAGDNRDSSEIICWFDEIDKNDDNQMTLQELKSALSKRNPAEVTETELRSCFNDIDKDKSGFITAAELKVLITKQGLKGDAAKYIEKVDHNKDGKINFEEFLKAWKAGQK